MDGGVPGRAQAFVVGVLLIVIARGLIARRYAAWVGRGGRTDRRHARRDPAPSVRGRTRRREPGRARRAAARLSGPPRPGPASPGRSDRVGRARIGGHRWWLGSAWRIATTRPTSATTVVGYLSTDAPTGWRAWLVTLVIAGSVVLAVVVAFLPAAPPTPGVPAGSGRRHRARGPGVTPTVLRRSRPAPTSRTCSARTAEPPSATGCCSARRWSVAIRSARSRAPATRSRRTSTCVRSTGGGRPCSARATTWHRCGGSTACAACTSATRRCWTSTSSAWRRGGCATYARR